MCLSHLSSANLVGWFSGSTPPNFVLMPKWKLVVPAVSYKMFVDHLEKLFFLYLHVQMYVLELFFHQFCLYLTMTRKLGRVGRDIKARAGTEPGPLRQDHGHLYLSRCHSDWTTGHLNSPFTFVDTRLHNMALEWLHVSLNKTGRLWPEVQLYDSEWAVQMVSTSWYFWGGGWHANCANSMMN